MVKAKSRWVRWGLAGILLFSAVTRLYRLEEPKSYYFDEVYHAFTARAYADNDPRGYEWWHSSPVEGTAYEWLHPPVAKLLMAGSIRVFGDNSWGWRLPSSGFGVLVIGAVYWLAKELTNNEKVGLAAAFVASLDGLLLVQSRIAMNDVFVTFFMLMALLFYWRSLSNNGKVASQSLLLAGIMTGLAVATKWSGVFVMGIVAIWETGRLLRGAVKELGVLNRSLITESLKAQEAQKRVLKRVGMLIASFVVIPAVIYLFSYGQFWQQGHSWQQFVDLHKQIWWYQTNLEATHTYQSRPWEWVLNMRPVWYQVSYAGDKVGNIYALANPVVAWGGLVAMVWVVADGLRSGRAERVFLGWAYLGVWAPWVVSPRIMFFYHYTPAMALLSVALGIFLVRLAESVSEIKKWGTKLAWLVGIGMLAGFVYFYPHWTGIEMSKSWVESYYWFEEWR